jgi:benzoylformate decarboxylase
MDEKQCQAARDRFERLLREKDDLRKKALAVDAAAGGGEGLHLSQFAQELAARLPTNALIFDEALTYSLELMRYLTHDKPGQYFQTRAGMLGTGLPGTIGLKIAHPDRLVIGFSGDGGSISTIQALATASRYGIGAKFVVCNNRSYRILKYNLQDYWRTLGMKITCRFQVARRGGCP